jgi:hypothetical protein
VGVEGVLGAVAGQADRSPAAAVQLGRLVSAIVTNEDLAIGLEAAKPSVVTSSMRSRAGDGHVPPIPCPLWPAMTAGPNDGRHTWLTSLLLAMIRGVSGLWAVLVNPPQHQRALQANGD